MKTRREFLADTCKFCLVAVSAGSILTLMDGCGSIKTITGTDAGDNKIKIPLKSFSDHTQVLVHKPNSDNLILATKKEDGSYSALSMVCTHKGQPLTVKDNSLYCQSHGSSFDFNGAVTHGPAARSLTIYPVSTTETDLVIDVK